MGDVGKGPAVYKGRRVLRCLYEVGVEGVPQQYGDSSRHAEVFNLEQLAIGSDAQHDVLNTTLEVFLAGSKAEDGHQLGGRGDVEACLRDHAVATQAGHYVTQGTVVDIEHALPEYLAQRETLLTVLVEIVV